MIKIVSGNYQQTNNFQKNAYILKISVGELLKMNDFQGYVV